MSGSTVRVMVAVVDGNDRISFAIEDYEGKAIISEDLASEENLFEFQPSRTDFHVLVFENSSPITQSVHWVVCVYYYDTLFQLLGVPLPILGLIMIALGGKKEERLLAEPVVKRKVRKWRKDEPKDLGMDITLVRGIGPKWSEEMKAVGIDSIHGLAECEPEDLAQEVGISEKMASTWVENANEILLLIKEAALSKG